MKADLFVENIGFRSWRLPAIYRRRKMRNIYLHLSSSELAIEALKSGIYTDEQTRLLIQLSLIQNEADREPLASRLVESFKA